LVATTAASAAPIPATAVAAAGKVTVKMANTTSRRTIPWGSSVRVTAKVIDPSTGKAATRGTVRLHVWSKGAWRVRGSAAVRKGTAVLSAKPGTTTWVRTEFSGSGYKVVRTAKIKITVRASGASVLAEAKRHTGALYKFAASGPKRFDCSGYTKYVYKKAAGKNLPHKANSQQKYGKAVSKSRKQVGDLIVFRNGSYGYHAGIYAGNGYIYDSPRAGKRVGKHKMWSNNYVVRRLVA
jgi:cell wall-associated NlpC family hydrolase